MKQKNGDEDVVTKSFFKKELKKELSKFATKTDLRNIEKSLRSEMLHVEQRGESLEDKMKQYKDEIITKIDGVMGELEAMREDSMIGTHQISELREEVDNHEKRINLLEQRKAA